MTNLPPNPVNTLQVPPPAQWLLGKVEQLTTHGMGLTPAVIRSIHDNHWIVLLDFEGVAELEISTWVSSERRTLARGGYNFGSITVRKIKALSYWINQKILQGRIPLVTIFELPTLRSSIEKFKIAKLELEFSETAQLPKKFNFDDYIDW